MNRDQMVQLAQRIAHAPTNDARICELTSLAPDDLLARFGLAHRSSALATAFGATGLLVIGAAIGAGIAIALTPYDGKEMQAKIRKQAKRVSRGVKRATADLEHRVADLTHAEPTGGSHRRATAHA